MARCPRRVATPIHFRFSSLFFPQWSILPPGSPRGCHLRKLNLRLSQPSLTSSYSSTALSRNEDTRTRHYEYNWIDGTESLEKYKPGGYHPITIGDMLQGRYHIVDKLGFGVPITHCNGKPLPPNIPAKAVLPLYLGKDAEEFSLSDAQIRLSDFGETFNPDLEPRLGKDCHTPLAARPPDAWFEIQTSLSYSADIWSLATAIWEIIGMKAIFSSEYTSVDEVICQQIDVLGSLPLEWFESWGKRDLYFDDDGVPKDGRYVWSSIDGAFEEGVQKYRRKFGMGEFDGEETAAFLDLMRRMLTFRPEERPTAREVLQSRLMVEWVLPDFERSSQMG
ncbi:unnamed protein product [Aspergillus oryzae]|uniref:non-specific serine/threonine protein kinase n=1 Tax=Aspergillus oryzae TaxID=5062 RepID=A0AAN4YKE7_ASPOZ|nr:unnamed protein product [Aspergillus oryzae]